MTYKKISIIIPNLDGGGAERMALNLANDWIKRGYEVDFVLLKKEGSLLNLVSSNIKIINLDVQRIRWAIFPLFKYFKKNRPSVAWVNMWPLTSIAVLAWIFAGRPGKIYLTDHNQLSISTVRELKIAKVWLKISMNVTYPFASGITAVSNGVALDMSRLCTFIKDRIKVIYNPIAKGIYLNRATKALRNKLWGCGYDFHILSVGSLKAQKNHALLIDAFAKLIPSINAKLIILGEGELRTLLANKIKSLDLETRVSLPGFFQDPYPWYCSADLFVLSSDWEGFGNVIVEALECGTPIVSTNCQSGPAEILENGLFGRLTPVGNIHELSNSIILSLHESHSNEYLKGRAKDFLIEEISKKYLQYFESA